jgi:pyruvate,orthophosphate dikinase
MPIRREITAEELREKRKAAQWSSGAMREANPMLGLRGCRLGLIFPQIIAMQVRAIFEAACNVAKKGIRCTPRS